MSAKLQVFVSSTFKDLKNERQAAVEAILKAHHLPAGMELFTAGSETQLEAIRRWIEDSDVLMLILGGRYGTIHEESGKSYTHLEYEYAISLNKPVFAVVIEENELKRRVKAHGVDAIEQEEPGKLREFRAQVLSRMSAFFRDERDIRLAVLESLPEIQKSVGHLGWVRAVEIEHLAKLPAELNELNKKLLAAQKEVLNLSQKLSKVQAISSIDEFGDIANALMRTELQVVAEGKTQTASALNLLLANRDLLFTGVTNTYRANEVAMFFFNKLCPRLETFGLASQEKNAGVAWRTYRLNKKGAEFLAFWDKNSSKLPESTKLGNKLVDASAPPDTPTPPPAKPKRPKKT